MEAAYNFIFVKIEQEFDDKITSESGKLKLDLMSFNQTVVDKDDQVIYNPLEKKRIWGEVVRVPWKLTKDTIIRTESPGLPEPDRYISHDQVQQHGTQLLQYGCYPFVPTYKTVADIHPDVQPGDKIYFHYGTVEKENQINIDNIENLYKLSYQNALCVVRNGEIIPVSGHCLIEAIWDDDIVDIGSGMKGKISPSGIITQTDVQYIIVETKQGEERLENTGRIKSKYLEGKVAYICKPLKGEEICFGVGDHIIFKRFADWKIKVEGKEYYCIKYWDIEAKFE
jgi:co-chaperonin GroES (HSP10)